MLLLNGCSYGWEWKSFPGINLSRSGGSFRRSIRTTMEYIAQGNRPEYIFIPITTCTRYEVARIDNDVEIEGPYTIDTELEHHELSFKLSDSCYRDWDYCFMDLIMFSSWLDSQGIKYLIWDQANNFDRVHITGFRAMEKLKFVESNPRIIDLFSFCGNQYMHDNGGVVEFEEDMEQTPDLRHYADKSYTILQDYLDQYIRNKLNETVDWTQK